MYAQADKYVFVVSPGRSGTNYLYNIFRCVDDVCAVHEPEHEYARFSPLRPQLWNLKDTPIARSRDQRRKLKLSQISDLLSETSASVYAETNPMFSTLWHDVILDEFTGKDVVVIVLRRNPVEVLKSLLDLGWFVDRDGNDWMVTAYSVNSLITPPMPEHDATPFDLVTGYLLNVEMYARRIAEISRRRGYKLVELYSDRLFGNVEAITQFLRQCGLEPDSRELAGVAAEKKNKAAAKNKRFDVPLDVCADRLMAHLKRYDEKGLARPDLGYPGKGW